MDIDVKRQRADVRCEPSHLNRADAPTQLPGWSTCLSFHFSRITFGLLLTVTVLYILAGCNDPFQPLQENDEAPFSMQGYLDASADTQWLRIVPVRELVSMPPVKPEMRVTLEKMESGASTVMNDSLFRLPNGINYLNVWTTMDIDPEQTYRLVAERPDGAASSVTVTLPEDFQTPELQIFGSGCTASLRIRGVERLADVQSKWHIRFYFSGRADDRYFSIPYRSQVFSGSTGNYSVLIDTNWELSRIGEQMVSTPDSARLIYRRLFVASGGPEWVADVGSLSELEYALPEGFSNVENGIGYVVGIVSKTIPFETCF